MAETLRVGVGMVGLEKVFKAAATTQKIWTDSLNKVAVGAQRTMALLEQEVAKALRLQGVTSGIFEVPYKMPIRLVEKGARDPKTGRMLQQWGEQEVGIRVDMGKLTRDEIRESQKREKIRERGLQRSIENEHAYNRRKAQAYDYAERLADRNIKSLDRIQSNEVVNRRRAYDNIERLYERHQKAMAKINRIEDPRTLANNQRIAYRNAEALLERHNKTMTRISSTEIRNRQTALENIEMYYARNQEKKRDYQRNLAQQKSHAIMGLASASIGLFGQAGFPMLNVAFASMSGLRYAGIAAVATAAGELARALIRLRENVAQSAESIGFISKQLKANRAAWEGMKAFYGGFSGFAEQKSLEEKTRLFNRSPASAGFMLREAAMERRFNLMENPQNALKALRLSGLYQGIWGQYKELKELRRETNMRDPEILRYLKDAREEARKSMFSYKATFQDPIAMWHRIQAAAASRDADDLKYKRITIEKLTEQIRALEFNTNALNANNRNNGNSGVPSGMSNIFRGYTYQ